MATRKPTSTKKRKTPSSRKPHTKGGKSLRPSATPSRANVADSEVFTRAIKQLGTKVVARITGAKEAQVARWLDTKKIPDTYAFYDVELSLTIRRLGIIKRRAAKVANVSKESREVYFEEYMALASKGRPTHAENARIVQILLNLGVDPHRPESYLRGAT